jgi:replicative DNA helicase
MLFEQEFFRMKDSKSLIPPNSKESEMMVLGSMLTSINSLNIAADSLNSPDFYYPEHQIIFDVLKTAYRNDKPADVHLVCEELKRLDKLNSIGGPAYVTSLAQYAGTSAFIEEYVEIVQNKSILRRMIQVAQDTERKALENPADVHAALDDAQQKLFTIGQAAYGQGGILIRDILSGAKAESKMPYLKQIQIKQEEFQIKGPQEASITGIPTHFIDLDRVINGLGLSNLIILAARPAMGKTALALNIAENICFKSGLPVGVFSLEMSADQLLHRLICSQAEVESDKLRTGNLNGQEFQRIVAAVNSMQKSNMVIDDQPGLKITDLRARARRMKETHGIQFLVVDYLQLLSGSGMNKSADNRQNEIAEISRMLKNLARELNIPVLCLSQLSRKVEERTGHRPMMSDLRESGCLAGDTLIQCAETGRFYTIKELAERKEQTPLSVHAVDKEQKLGKYTMSKVFYSGKKVVYELKTKSGRSIKASGNHPFLQKDGWVRLDKLKKGDAIGLPGKLSIESPSTTSSDKEVSFLAHLFEEGCLLPVHPYYAITTKERKAATVHQASTRFLSKQKAFFNYYGQPHLYSAKAEETMPKIGSPIKSKLPEEIAAYSLQERKIPEQIFSCNNAQISLFLKHLWKSDQKILGKREKKTPIYYSFTSKTLCQQTQHLLLRLGIQSTLKTLPAAKGYKASYQVCIEGAINQEIFLTSIGSSENRCLGASPIHAPIRPQFLYNKKISDKNFPLPHSLYKKHPTTPFTFRNASLPHNEVYFDEIVSISELGVEDVYDATVDVVHNFVANDIIVHNSIEQDSDIVIFLLRREYYDAYDKPGQAEVIIAKNRHGGVGSVFLAFRKELAQFGNYSGAPERGGGSTEDAFSAFSPK